MTHMKSISLRDMQHHLSEAIRRVDHGEEVVVTRRGRAIARLVPIRPDAGQPPWPDFVGRAVRLKRPGLSKAVLDERDHP